MIISDASRAKNEVKEDEILSSIKHMTQIPNRIFRLCVVASNWKRLIAKNVLVLR